MRRYFFLLLVLCAGCAEERKPGPPEKVLASDPRVAELLAVLAASNHTELGFSPILPDYEFKLEIGKRGGAFDRQLHVRGRTLRTVAFKKAGSGWRWTREQEIFEGPRKHTTMDGTFSESLCLSYEVGHPSRRLNVSYSGDDAQLAWPRELSLADALPVLAAWGHDVSRAPTSSATVNAEVIDNTGRQRNAVTVLPDPYRVVLVVDSPTGLGRVRLTPAGRDWPERIEVRLNLKTLASFTVDNGSAKVRTSFMNYPPYDQSCDVSITGDRRISTANPYWIFGQKKRGDGTFELTLPAALFKDRPAAVNLQWLDRHR
jgi:hypothetical protein